MNEETVRNWIKKVENNLKIGKDKIITNNPTTDAIYFHIQQCIEKYLKAYFIFHGKEFRKTHDIAELIEICSESDLAIEDLEKIDAVEIRYGDEEYFPTIEGAKESIRICEQVQDFIISKLKAKVFTLPNKFYKFLGPNLNKTYKFYF